MQSVIAIPSLLTLLLAPSVVQAVPGGNRPGEGVETVAAHVVAHNNPVSDGTTSQSFNLTLPFGTLALYEAQQVTSLSFVGTTSRVPGVTVDSSAAVCRRYLDPYGQQPGSEPFSLGKDAFVSTNSVTVKYILCYTVGDAEHGN